MVRNISIEEFSGMIVDRDVQIVCSSALLEIERYHGRDIHKVPERRRDLTVMLNWVQGGWLAGARTFREAQTQYPSEFRGLVLRLYTGFVDELYTI